MNLQGAGGSHPLHLAWNSRLQWISSAKILLSTGPKSAPSHMPKHPEDYPMPYFKTFHFHILLSWNQSPHPFPPKKWERGSLIQIIRVIDEARVTRLREGVERAEKCDPVSWLSCINHFPTENSYMMVRPCGPIGLGISTSVFRGLPCAWSCLWSMI